MTVLDLIRDHNLAVADQQAACGLALHLLVTETHRVTGKPLPLLLWVIRDQQPRLHGASYAVTDAERADAVRAWASHLGAQPIVTTVDDDVVIGFDTAAHGVKVHIQARLSQAKESAA